MAGLQKIIHKHGIKISEYDIFVETGLYQGENISSMYINGHFDNIENVYSIELNKNYIDNAYINFEFLKESNVKLLHGDSGIILGDILGKNNDKKFILWLDAHYSGGDTSKSEFSGECPILSEIESIKYLKNKPTIIIDDLGCFMDNTIYYYKGWPRIEEIISIAKKYFDFDVFMSDRDEENQLHYCILR